MKAGRMFLCGLSALSAYLVYEGSMKWTKVTRETVFFNCLPKHLDGLRILHISDLHSNNPHKMNVDIWSVIKNIKFDIVLITGDVIVNKIEELNPHLPEIKKLAKKVPVFFTDGNHEMFMYEEISELLESLGVNVLNDAAIDCYLSGYGLVRIIGVRDYKNLQFRRFNMLNRLFDPDDERFKLVLSHQPQLFDIIKNCKNMLVFSGHTHGGQVRLPFFPSLFSPGQGLFPRYGEGLHTCFSNKLFISKGIGATVFPVRFYNRPELGLITVKVR